jgi:hypothetical protein
MPLACGAARVLLSGGRGDALCSGCGLPVAAPPFLAGSVPHVSTRPPPTTQGGGPRRTGVPLWPPSPRPARLCGVSVLGGRRRPRGQRLPPGPLRPTQGERCPAAALLLCTGAACVPAWRSGRGALQGRGGGVCLSLGLRPPLSPSQPVEESFVFGIYPLFLCRRARCLGGRVCRSWP